MKKHLLTLLTLGSMSLSALVAGQSLKLGTTDNQLLISPVFTEVLGNLGISVEFEALPLARGHSELAAGSIDGFFLVNDQVATSIANTVLVPVAIVDTDYVAVSLKPDQVISSAADFSNYQVGIERGNRTQQFLAQGAKGVHEAANSLALFRMLEADRIDFLITNRPEVPRVAEEAGIGSFTIQEPSLMTINLFLILSDKHQSQVGAIAQAFEQAKESGRIAEIFAEIESQQP